MRDKYNCYFLRIITTDDRIISFWKERGTCSMYLHTQLSFYIQKKKNFEWQ